MTSPRPASVSASREIIQRVNQPFVLAYLCIEGVDKNNMLSPSTRVG
jgi:hypothetical protein